MSVYHITCSRSALAMKVELISNMLHVFKSVRIWELKF